jgi:hypothetical protein
MLRHALATDNRANETISSLTNSCRYCKVELGEKTTGRKAITIKNRTNDSMPTTTLCDKCFSNRARNQEHVISHIYGGLGIP